MRYDPLLNRWFKYTIPGHSGFTVDWDGSSPPVLRMATLLEYFERLLLQNNLFKDDIHLVGLWQDILGGGWRIVSSQPDITGDPATRIQILEGMKLYHFTPLGVPGVNKSPAFRNGPIIVWDAHPGNYVWKDDTLVPIDLIITESLQPLE